MSIFQKGFAKMSEEREISTDLELSSEHQEVNTYDFIPLYEENNKKEKRTDLKNLFKKIYSFAAITTLLLTVIFSSAELLDFIVNDMGTGNIIMKRIFSHDLMGKGFNLSEMIIKNSFIIPEKESSSPPRDNSPVETPPYANLPESVPDETPSETPKESESSTSKPSTEPPPSTENSFPIIQMDMSLLSYGKHYIYNDTTLNPNIGELSSAILKNHYQSDAPLVLVIHTHATESFMPEGAKYYIDEGELARSHNTSENMIAVGVEFVKILEENGIPTLHCVILHDKESYRESYSRAAESIEKYLKEYPSIKYVFDLHRDSLMRSTGELISAVTSVNGENTAQVMPVVGSGYNGWEENMTFALKLRAKLNGEHTNLCRPVCLRASNYNQGLSEISVLIEIGTSGNSLSEAKKAASLTAQAIAQLIISS